MHENLVLLKGASGRRPFSRIQDRLEAHQRSPHRSLRSFAPLFSFGQGNKQPKTHTQKGMNMDKFPNLRSTMHIWKGIINRTLPNTAFLLMQLGFSGNSLTTSGFPELSRGRHHRGIAYSCNWSSVNYGGQFHSPLRSRLIRCYQEAETVSS